MKKQIFLIFFFISIQIFGNEKIGSQELIQKLDEFVQFKNGMTTAKLILKQGNYTKKKLYLKIFKNDSEILIHFNDQNRTNVSKIYSNLLNQKIIHYRTLGNKFYQIEDDERLENFLFSFFSYLDLSFKPFESNFISETGIPNLDSHEEKDFLLSLKPISFPNYFKLEIKFNKDFEPIRIDYFNKKDLLFKTCRFMTGIISKRTNGYVQKVDSLKKIEMQNLDNNEISILEIMEYEEEIKPEKVFFEWRNLKELE